MRAGGGRWRSGSDVHVQPRPHHTRAPTPSRHHPTDAVVTALVTALPARGAPAHPAPGVSLCETSTRAVVCAPLSPRRSPFQAGRRARASPAAGEHDGLGQDEAAEAQRLTDWATSLWRGRSNFAQGWEGRGARRAQQPVGSHCTSWRGFTCVCAPWVEKGAQLCGTNFVIARPPHDEHMSPQQNWPQEFCSG